jgi:hypothetical protein
LVEIAALAAFLAPFLPYLVKAGETFADNAATALGENAWGFAQKLWGKLRPKVEEKEAANEAAEDVAAAPDDNRAKAALELQLEKLLSGDPALAAELKALWDEGVAAKIVSASGDRSIAVGGNASGIFITGDDAQVTR